MKAKRSERLYLYLEPSRKARIVSAALKSGLSLSEFIAEATEKVIDRADGVRDQLAPFVAALEDMREELRYDLRSHANQNIEENRIMRSAVRQFIEQSEQDTRQFHADLLDKQAKAIQVAIANAAQMFVANKGRAP